MTVFTTLTTSFHRNNPKAMISEKQCVPLAPRSWVLNTILHSHEPRILGDMADFKAREAGKVKKSLSYHVLERKYSKT